MIDRYRLRNTDRVISGLILIKLLLSNLEFVIELYLVRQIPENTDRVVSCLILTKVLLSDLEFVIELYLVRQIPKDTEGYTWIGTDLKVFVGEGHLLHTCFWSSFSRSPH